MAVYVNPVYGSTLAVKSHAVNFRCDVWDWERSTLLQSNIKMAGGGTVSIQAGGQNARSAQISIIDDDGSLLPRNPGDLLHPYSFNLLRVWADVFGDSGDKYSFPLITGRINKMDMALGGGQYPITLYDDSWWAARGRVWQGGGRVQAPAEPLEDRLARYFNLSYAPSTPWIVSPGTGITVPAELVDVTLGGDNAYATALSMLQQNGLDLHIDGLGNYVIVPIGPSSSAPIATFSDSAPNPLSVAALQRGWSMDDFANVGIYKLVSTDQGSSGAVVGSVSDDYTRYDTGRFGAIPVQATGNSTTNTEDAMELAAESVLSAHNGASESVSFTAVPDYRLEDNDVIELAIGSLSAYGLYDISKVDFQLTPGQPMTVTCANVRLP
jgi:hypothetical protein